jgi:hypothetical protein
MAVQLGRVNSGQVGKRVATGSERPGSREFADFLGTMHWVPRSVIGRW